MKFVTISKTGCLYSGYITLPKRPKLDVVSHAISHLMMHCKDPKLQWSKQQKEAVLSKAWQRSQIQVRELE